MAKFDHLFPLRIDPDFPADIQAATGFDVLISVSKQNAGVPGAAQFDTPEAKEFRDWVIATLNNVVAGNQAKVEG